MSPPPLRLLLGNDTEFVMQQPQLQAIHTLKTLVTTSPVLQFFNPNCSTRLRTDASSEGLGALIEQNFDGDWKSIGYALRSLNSAEKQYAQIEKEILSIVFGCENIYMDTSLLFRMITSRYLPYFPSLFTKLCPGYNAFIYVC